MAGRKRIKPNWGQRTIRLTVAFHTNRISKKAGYVVKREAWDTGTVVPHTNRAHGITPGRPVVHFNSLAELPFAIEKCLIAHGVKVRPGRRSQKYIATV
jgi:hypothetical protein